MSSKIKELSNLELSSFCSQMAMVLKAGVSPLEGISIMNEDPSSRDDGKILTTMEEVVTATGSLAQAARQAGVFPSYFVHMTEIGEQAGRLDDVMDALSEHYSREAQIHAAIKHAVTYPFVMISMMMIVVLVLVMKVLPAFHEAFQQMGHELTGFSRGILEFGLALNQYSLVIIVVFALLMLLFLFCSGTAKGRAFFLVLARKLGVGKRISDAAAACRMASGMSIVLSSGLNVERSMELTAALVENAQYNERISACQKSLEQGADFGEAMKKSGLFSGIYIRMATVGYRTGSLDEVMRKIARNYEEDLDSRISRVIAVLEPTLVAVLSLVVGVVLLSVMLPLMGVMASF